MLVAPWVLGNESRLKFNSESGRPQFTTLTCYSCWDWKEVGTQKCNYSQCAAKSILVHSCWYLLYIMNYNNSSPWICLRWLFIFPLPGALSKSKSLKFIQPIGTQLGALIGGEEAQAVHPCPRVARRPEDLAKVLQKKHVVVVSQRTCLWNTYCKMTCLFIRFPCLNLTCLFTKFLKFL